MDPLRATRQWLQKQFKTSGIQLDSAALARLVREVQDVEDPEDYVHAFIEEVETSERAGQSAGPGCVAAAAAGDRRRQGRTGRWLVVRPPAHLYPFRSAALQPPRHAA